MTVLFLGVTDMTPTDTLDLIWEAKAIGHYIGRSERQTFYLLKNGRIRGAIKKDGRWCIPRKALIENFYNSADSGSSVDAKLFAEFEALMTFLSPEEQSEVLLHWT